MTGIVIISLVVSVVSLIAGLVSANKAKNTPISTKETTLQIVSDFKKTEMNEGLIVPIIYGNAEISGNIIWYDYVQSDPTHYTIRAWLVLCQGEIERLYSENLPLNHWILIDKKVLKAANLTYYFKSGNMNIKLPQYTLIAGDKYNILDALPDNGKYATALQNLCHVFFYNYELEEYSNSIPNLSFRVKRKLYTGIVHQDVYINETVIDFLGTMDHHDFAPLKVTEYWSPWIKSCMSEDGKYRLVIHVDKSRSTWNFRVQHQNMIISNDYGATYNNIAIHSYPTNCCMSYDGKHMLVTRNLYYPIISHDYGVTWSELVTIIGGTAEYSCCAMNDDGTKIMIGAINWPLIFSGNGGITWTRHLAGKLWCSIAMSKGALTIAAIAIDDTTVNLTRDGGVTWENKGILNSPSDICMDENGSRIYISNSGTKKIYGSLNSGDTWENLNIDDINSLWGISCDRDGKFILVSQTNDTGTNGYFTSSDYGGTWTERYADLGWLYRDIAISGDAHYYNFITFTDDEFTIVDISTLEEKQIFIGHNPVAVFYDLLINQLKKTESDLNLVNFNEIAELMEAKKYAANMTIAAQISITEIKNLLQSVFDIFLIKNSDDKYELLIFQDSDILNCKATITDEFMIEFNVTRKSWDDTINSVTATYLPAYEIDTKYPEGVNLYGNNQRTFTMKDDANILMTGNIRPKTIDLSIIGYLPAVQNRVKDVLMRESYPFSIGQLTVSLVFGYLQIGDIIRIQSNKFTLDSYYRIIDAEEPEIDKNERTYAFIEVRETITSEI